MATATLPPPSDEFLRQFERGLSALERGDPRAAQLSFAELAKGPERNHWTRIGLATCALLQRDFAAAANEFNAITQAADPPPVAFAGLGAALLNQGKTTEALAQLEIAARRSPAANPRFMLACALCLANQPERAAAECERATRALPNGPTGSLRDEVRGLAAYLSGDHKLAIEHFRRMLAQPVTAGRTTLVAPPLPSPAITRAERASGAIGRQEAADPSAIARKEPTIARANSTGLTFTIRRRQPGANDNSDESSRTDEATDRHLSGVAPILVSLPEVEGVRYVVIVIDGKQRGFANKEPFRWQWDTTTVTNGSHKLAIHAYGAGEKPLRTEEREVEVRNGLADDSASSPIARRAGTDASPLEQTYNPRFERLLEFQPDLIRVRYLLAQAYEAEGLNDFAAEELALIFLEKPNYLDARKRLLAMRARLGPTYRAEALPELRGVPRNDKVVALTFDDGPRTPYTQRILEILRQHNLRATFFLVGKMVDTYPQLARDLVADGHELANHSYEHENMGKLTTIECEQDVLRCERAVLNATGLRVNLFRPPGGHYGPELKQALGNFGYSTVFWTSNITSFPGKAPDEIAERMAERVGSGGLLLLHNGQDQTVFVLPRLIDILKRRGFRLVTVSQLLERPAP